ncbi:MAG TPA: VOC family protein [Chitinophaga sp.]|uniref:VOC family protein n=1 Tax=Chitinophaga sp. TaxID=1869181 RepID=UPI002B98E68A|nr:VOC family protein [Chitinophaga sp.]HVI43479.1 VOC family protein [Chitinophaga sp.]
MATKIFVNLPVKNLQQSMDFFSKLGFTFNPQFTDDTAACMIISEDIFSMLLTHEKFQEFLPEGNTIADASVSEVLTCLSRDSREKVNEFADTAIKAGGKEVREAKDYGFMYTRSVRDLDGHVWELIWMDPAFINSPENAAAAGN